MRSKEGRHKYKCTKPHSYSLQNVIPPNKKYEFLLIEDLFPLSQSTSFFLSACKEGGPLNGTTTLSGGGTTRCRRDKTKKQQQTEVFSRCSSSSTHPDSDTSSLEIASISKTSNEEDTRCGGGVKGEEEAIEFVDDVLDHRDPGQADGGLELVSWSQEEKEQKEEVVKFMMPDVRMLGKEEEALGVSCNCWMQI